MGREPTGATERGAGEAGQRQTNTTEVHQVASQMIGQATCFVGTGGIIIIIMTIRQSQAKVMIGGLPKVPKVITTTTGGGLPKVPKVITMTTGGGLPKVLRVTGGGVQRIASMVTTKIGEVD